MRKVFIILFVVAASTLAGCTGGRKDFLSYIEAPPGYGQEEDECHDRHGNC